MNKFIWTDEYKLDIKVIDDQHMHFFEIVNNIYDKLAGDNTDKEELKKVIRELMDYAFYHLDTEEQYFNQFAYADIANHMKAHTLFRKETQEYYDRVKSANEDLNQLALEVTDFAKNWLMKHILVSDKSYAPLFKQHGL